MREGAARRASAGHPQRYAMPCLLSAPVGRWDEWLSRVNTSCIRFCLTRISLALQRREHLIHPFSCFPLDTKIDPAGEGGWTRAEFHPWRNEDPSNAPCAATLVSQQSPAGVHGAPAGPSGPRGESLRWHHAPPQRLASEPSTRPQTLIHPHHPQAQKIKRCVRVTEPNRAHHRVRCV